VLNILQMNYTHILGRPGPVRNVKVEANYPHTASLSWQRPINPNGRIIDYIVTVYPKLDDNAIDAQIDVTPRNITVPADMSDTQSVDVPKLIGLCVM
jgi:hypothetical protein